MTDMSNKQHNGDPATPRSGSAVRDVAVIIVILLGIGAIVVPAFVAMGMPLARVLPAAVRSLSMVGLVVLILRFLSTRHR